MPSRRRLSLLLQVGQLAMHQPEIEFRLGFGRADVSGNVQIEVVLPLDLLKAHDPRIAIFFPPLAVGIDDLVDVLGQERVLALPRLIMLGRVDEQHIIGALALLEYQDADRNAGRVEQFRRQADHGVDIAVLQQFCADPLIRPAPEQHAVRQDDRHGAVLGEEVEPVQQEGEIGRRLRREAVIPEAEILLHLLGRAPAVAEGWIGDDRIELDLLRRVRLAQDVPIVFQTVAVVDIELGIPHAVQEHVHAGEVVGGDVLFLPVDLANPVLADVPAHVQQKRARAAGEIVDAVQLRPRAERGSWASSVTMRDRMVEICCGV